MIVNHIERILANAGIRANVEWQENGLWLITEVHFNASNALAGLEAPFEIPSMQPERWLELVFAGDTEGAQALEVGGDHGTT